MHIICLVARHGGTSSLFGVVTSERVTGTCLTEAEIDLNPK